MKVYRLTGDVKIKQNSGLSLLHRRAVVNPSDQLIIPENGKVEILDETSRRIYSSLIQGSFSVKDIIEMAKKNSSEITKITNEQVLIAVKDNAATQRDRFGKTGASWHETDADLSGLISLPEGVTYLAYLMAMSPTEEYDNCNDVILVRRNRSEEDDTFNFSVFNTLEQPLYINIIDQKPTDEINLYFQESPLVNPRRETQIPEYRYLLPESITGYIVIASDKPFSIKDVKQLLDSSNTPENNFYFSLLRI